MARISVTELRISGVILRESKLMSSSLTDLLPVYMYVHTSLTDLLPVYVCASLYTYRGNPFIEIHEV